METKVQSDASDPDYSSSPVPLSARMTKGGLMMAYWAICSAMFWLVVAATLAINYGTVNALIGLGLSVVVYTIVNRVIVRYAIDSGLSVALFSRVLFGSFGASLATLIFFATAIYYAVFEGSVIGVAINAYFPSISLKMAYLIVVIYSVLLVFGSVQAWLDKLNGVLLPFYVIGLLAAVVAAYQSGSDHTAWLNLAPAGGAPANGWWNCFAVFMGVWILMMYTWDYARFGKPEDLQFHQNYSFGWLFYAFTFLLNGVAGIFIASTVAKDGAVTEVSVVLALLKLMGFTGLVFVWVSQTRINTANFYLAAINMQAFFRSALKLDLPKFVWSIAVGGIVYALMLTDVFSFILKALAYQGIFVVAWVGIALAHIGFTRGMPRPEYRVEHLPALNGAGLFAWFASSGLGIVLMEFGGDVSSFSAPAAALGSALIYWGLLAREGRSSLVGR